MIILLPGQDPEKKSKKPQSAKIIVDTTIVSERAADTIYMEQTKVISKLDSLIQEKQKK